MITMWFLCRQNSQMLIHVHLKLIGFEVLLLHFLLSSGNRDSILTVHTGKIQAGKLTVSDVTRANNLLCAKWCLGWGNLQVFIFTLCNHDYWDCWQDFMVTACSSLVPQSWHKPLQTAKLSIFSLYFLSTVFPHLQQNKKDPVTEWLSQWPYYHSLSSCSKGWSTELIDNRISIWLSAWIYNEETLEERWILKNKQTDR